MSYIDNLIEMDDQIHETCHDTVSLVASGLILDRSKEARDKSLGKINDLLKADREKSKKFSREYYEQGNIDGKSDGILIGQISMIGCFSLGYIIGKIYNHFKK